MRKIALSILFTFLSSRAPAQDSSVNLKWQPEAQAPIEVENISKSSTEIRQQKTYMATVTPYGLGPSSEPESGIAVGRFLSPSTILLFAVGTGSNHRNESVWDKESNGVQTNSLSVAFRHFIGNSFYATAGIDYRTVSYGFHYGNTLFGYGNPDSPKSTYDFKGSSWSGNTAIGNQWQWNSFTLGCDWFGIVLPLASQVTGENLYDNGSGTFTDEIRKDRQQAEDHYLKNVAYEALRFYIGASF